jgi:hypothetical protein
VVGVATVIVGTEVIRVTPPDSDTSPSHLCAYECLRPGANPVVPGRSDPLVSYGRAMWNSGMQCGPVSSSYTGGAD